MAKQKKVYRLDENGEKIYDRVKRQYKCTTQKINDWDEPHNVEQWREKWAEVCNVEFARLGLSKRLTHESYQRQGVDLIPTKHLGSVSASMERKGVRTKAGEKNQHIYLQNVKMIIDMTYKTLCKLMEKAKQMLQQLKRQMKHERSEQKQIFYCEQLPLLLCNMEHEKPKIPHSLLHNTEHEKPKICRYARKYQQYERKYIRPPSRSFVPSL